MRKTNKLGFTILLSFFLAFIIFNFSERKAEASAVTPPTVFHFTFNGHSVAADGKYEMITPYAELRVETSSLTNPITSVVWSSSATSVAEVEAAGTNSADIIRQGPGYSDIIATVSDANGSRTISFEVKVDLEFDYGTGKTDAEYATTTNERILILDTIDQEKQAFLKYIDYTPTGEIVAVSGSAITVPVNWESDNTDVATVDVNGFIKAIGSGNATITVTSNTVSSAINPLPITKTLKVIVAPKFSLTFNNSSNVPVTYNSTYGISPAVDKVPSHFILKTTAEYATNLDWEVYDCSTSPKRKLSEGNSNKINNLTINTGDGDVSFYGVKAGTYEIYAFADTEYTTGTDAPYAYMKIIVPIDLGDVNLIMSVGDTYSIIDNSNITGLGIFGAPAYSPSGGQSVAQLDTTNYIITARRKGDVSIELAYNHSSMDLFPDDDSVDYVPPTFTINIKVIDGIALSTTNATLYTQGTLLLVADSTDSAPITWTSSDTKIASVVNGLVKGLTEGPVVITASQKINGIMKNATCKILVQPSVETIVVNPAQATLAIGAFTSLHAIITPNLSNVNIQWRSSNENIVSVIPINTLDASIQGVAGGTAVISAINQDNVVVGYCYVSVRQPVTGIALSETEGTVKITDKHIQLRASVSPADALNKTVIWTSSNTDIATVDNNGLVSLKKSGSVTITATSDDSPKVFAWCNLTIEVPVVSIALDETAKVMYVGQFQRLTYTILPVNASNNVVTWSSTNASVATVDNTGKVTAKAVGSTIIMLKTAEGGFSVFCTITVKSVATAVKLDVSELNLKVGEYYYIKSTFTPKDATDTNIVWESSETKIAIVDSAGKVTAKGAGAAIIMARTEAGGVAYCKVNVRQPVSGILLNFSEKITYVGAKFQIEASLSPSAATDLSVTWKSSNEKVATVSGKGEVTGVIGGVAVITCTTVDGGFAASCVITVRETVTTIKLSNDNYNLGVKKTFTLTATVSNETATNQNVIWSSSNDSIATVSQKGKVTGIAVGYATITATALDGSDVEASCEIRVVTPVSSVTISDNYISLYVGDSEKLKATITPSSATYKKAIWTSSDPAVAIVDDGGTIIALKAGSATITAESQDNSGKKAICVVMVYDRLPATGITLQDKKLTMAPGETKVVDLVLIPAASTDSYTWSTDNPSVAKVDRKSGKITAVATGTAYVTIMTDSGKTASVEVTVIGLNVTEIVIEQYTDFEAQLVVEGYTGQVKWSIDNPAIATVANGYVSSRGVGTATITATVNGRKLTCKITVVKIGS